jgi:hypothetical protein
MECQLASSEEFQVLEKRLLNEVKKLYRTFNEVHSHVYIRLMEKVQLKGDIMETVGRNTCSYNNAILSDSQKEMY